MSRRPSLLQARIRLDIFGKKVEEGLHIWREARTKIENGDSYG
jgi:hypothetical protein